MARQIGAGLPAVIAVLLATALVASHAEARDSSDGAQVPLSARTSAPPGSDEDADEEARRAANLAAYERLQAQKQAAAKAAAERAEAAHAAVEKVLAAKNEQLAAEQRAAAAKVAAAQQKKRQEQAAVAADVDRVLQRAKSDYPVLATPQGEPWLRKIMDRQQALVAGGTYPSIAMVEAISDHAHALAPRPSAELQTVSTNVARSAPAMQPASFNGCRWVSSIKWACD